MMRLKFQFALLVTLAGRLAAAEEAKAPMDVPAPTAMHKAAAPLKIDGELNEADWQKAGALPVDYVNSKQGGRSETPRMKVRYLWDDRYLYIGYEFYSKNLKAQGTGKSEGPPGNERDGAEIFLADKKVDIAEFFISFGDRSFFWEIHHNELNQFNDVYIVVPEKSWKASQQANVPFGIIFAHHEWLDDEGPYTFARAVKLLPKEDGKPSTVNDPSDVDTGYSGEIRIPWYGLGAPASRRGAEMKSSGPRKDPPEREPWKMAGVEMNILAVFQDTDLPDRYHHSSPTKPPGGWFHTCFDDWQIFTLTDDK